MAYANIEDHRDYMRGHYDRNRQYYLDKSKRAKDKINGYIKAAKNVPCCDCDILYPHYVMQFDHVRGVKKFTIGESCAKQGFQQVVLEIEKCDIVCANCHSARTWRRRLGNSAGRVSG